MASAASMHCTYDQEAVGGLVDRITQLDWSSSRTTHHSLCFERIAAIMPNGVLSKEPLASTPSLATMQALLQDLDTLVFRKAISPRCDFAWDPQLSVASQPGHAIKGLCQSPQNGRITIKLNPTRMDNWWEIIETLLHELCHGWLYLYGCDRSCGNASHCRMISAMGATGHGWAFLKIALAVEEFALQHLVPPNRLFQLNGWQAAVMEYKASDVSMTDRCLLELFVDWEQGLIAQMVKRKE